VGEHEGEKAMPAKKTTIVIADDDLHVLRLVERNVEFEGYEVHAASDGEQALELIVHHVPDVVILDVMMPHMDGFTVCQRVREFSTVPIIILTARGQDQDKIRGLDLGADDYLTKPFSVGELLARVHAVLRRAQLNGDEVIGSMQPTITIGDVTIDYAHHIVKRSDQEIALTPIEYRLLAYLAKYAGRVVTQDQLLEAVWGTSYLGESHLLQVNINRLRHKLESDPTHPHFILTKAGVGYLLSPQSSLTTTVK
jgi:DNA-binding response OmpR family regulator